MTDLINGTNASEFIDALWPKRTIGNDERINGLGGNDFIYGYDGADGLYGGAGNDTVYGDGGSDFLSGGADADLLQGHAGSDVLDGGDGLDKASYADKGVGVAVTLAGTLGASVYVGGVSEDLIRNIEGVIGGSGHDDLVGDGLANHFEGNSGNDNLRGGSGDDRLLGGLGNDGLIGGGDSDQLMGGGGQDFLDGGLGFDAASYEEHTAGVKVALNASFGVDVYVGGVLEDLMRNVEAVIGGLGQDIIAGDSLDNLIDGYADADALNGGGGADGVYGGAGRDTLMAGADADIDTLDGGAGADLAVYVHETRDIDVILAATDFATVHFDGVGEDRIRHIEDFTGGRGNDIITGSSLANRLSGGAGFDTLNGGLGDDTLVGGAGSDSMDGGGGFDAVDYSAHLYGMSVSLGADFAIVLVAQDATGSVHIMDEVVDIEKVIGTQGADWLFGNDRANSFSGRNADDNLSGGGGKDTLDGGAGVDHVTYDYSDNIVAVTLNGAAAASVVVGGVAEDTISGIEDVTGGTAADRLIGDGLDNRLNGLGGADRLNGGGGNDSLAGGAANDVLAGAAGADTFLFFSAHSTLNFDSLVDFASADDTIMLDNKIFSGLAEGTLAASAFFVGTAAHDANDRIIYNSATGNIFYDADGSGSIAAIRFAQVTPGTGMANVDFLVS